jgi:membrane dipeptidase
MRFIDLHGHYPMHLGLPTIPGDDLALKAVRQFLFDTVSELDNYEAWGHPRIDGRYVHAGGISGFASVLLDAEDEVFREQKPHPDAFPHVVQLLKNVQTRAKRDAIAVVKDAAALDHCLNAGTPFLVHCVEGGFALSGKPENVANLADLGVCYIVLAHLRYMGLAGSAQGLPCKTAFWQHLFDPADAHSEIGLTPLGKDIVDAIMGSRLLLDITHCSDPAKRAIIAHYRDAGYRRPVISSHTGVRALSHHELNLDNDTIQFIAGTGGVVGIIAFPYWLSDTPSLQTGFAAFCHNVDYVVNLVGPDAVAIGTDLDGFIQPLKECRDYSMIASFANQLAGQFDNPKYGPDFLDKLLWKNARRAITAAWS